MKRVLVVDDSIAVARQLEKIVNSDEEFEVVAQGRNGAEAIKLCQQHKPDILCMDMNMPVMDGLTALRNLMQIIPDLKVIMVTSLGGVGDKYTEAIRLGAKDVISKPFEKDNVLEMLKRL
ncbi:response regulator [Malonomonas rubra]|uniref:response regulator n=1 Tax=Malonomonas rubra TaxID=57040 RepID=UPI0026F1907F|nr:response regulator [Malonomonas rubra]